MTLNENVNIMQNHGNFKSSLVQLLVQNYLEQEFDTKSVFVYDEIINDVDVFDKDLTQIEQLVTEIRSRKRLTNKLTIHAFLGVVPDAYLYSYEVKSGVNDYIFLFNHLMQLISKCKYPDKTKLELITVPDGFNSCFDEEKADLEQFEDLKQQIFSDKFNENDRYLLFNAFANDNTLKRTRITSALIIAMSKCENNKLTSGMYKNNITNEEYEMLKNNFKKVSIRVLTYEELVSKELQKELIISVLTQ